VKTGLSTSRAIVQTARDLDDDDPWSYFASGYIERLARKYDDAIAWTNTGLQTLCKLTYRGFGTNSGARLKCKS
jgi:2-hydroxychromene-2-carboxylate isomerase